MILRIEFAKGQGQAPARILADASLVPCAYRVRFRRRLDLRG